jgi:hypothetical protein
VTYLRQMLAQLDEQGFTPRGDPPQKFLEDTKAEAKIWAETISRGKLAIADSRCAERRTKTSDVCGRTAEDSQYRVVR